MPHTLRGTITSSITGTLKHLITDDGRYTNGLEVVDFVVWPQRGTAINDFTAILGREFDMVTDKADASDSRQFGWVTGSEIQSGATAQQSVQTVLDPFKVVVRDLFISVQSSTDQVYNYMIGLLPGALTPEEGVLQLIQEKSQDDTR